MANDEYDVSCFPEGVKHASPPPSSPPRLPSVPLR